MWRVAMPAPREPRREQPQREVAGERQRHPSPDRSSRPRARVRPSTSISHGTDQSPWIAMNDPMPTAPSGTIHQKRGSANTRRTPPHCAREARRLVVRAAGRARARRSPPPPRASRPPKHREQRPPVHEAQRELDRRGRDQRAGAARDHDPAGERRLPLRRIPGRRSPSAAPSGRPRRRARSARARPPGIVRLSANANAEGAGRGDHQQHRLDPARSVAVEQHAGGDLHRREGHEVRAGQQAERARLERRARA